MQDFAKEVIGKPVFVVCNSVGGVVGLQAGVNAPEQVNLPPPLPHLDSDTPTSTTKQKNHFPIVPGVVGTLTTQHA